MGLLEKLMNVFGVSGNEENIREMIKNEIKKYADEVSLDKLGNLIVRKKGEPPKVMLAAHMDEIGLVIKSIERGGKIFCSPVGGIEAITLLGERVHIETKKGIIHGVITTREISDGIYTTKLPKMENLIVDTGLSRRGLKRMGVEIGTYLSLEQEPFFLGSENIICGKALDNRIGCYILIELAKRLKKIKNEVYYVFTVQEEMGLFGAITSTYIVEPDWALAVDVSETCDSTGEITKTIGKGPCLTIKDSDMIANKCLNDWIRNIAKKKKIPIQLDVSDLGTTDAVSISISRGGVPSSVVSVPVRNLHTPTAVAHKKDIENTIKLLEELLKNPPKVCF